MDWPQGQLPKYASFDALLFKGRLPKVSSLGTRFFAHRSRGACQTAPESPEHLKAKFVIAQSARAVGWRASTE